MYDINKIRKKYNDNPTSLELINLLHLQIVQNNYAKRIKIVIPKGKHYSSKLKKTAVHELGYTLRAKKLSNEFEIFRAIP